MALREKWSARKSVSFVLCDSGDATSETSPRFRGQTSLLGQHTYIYIFRSTLELHTHKYTRGLARAKVARRALQRSQITLLCTWRRMMIPPSAAPSRSRRICACFAYCCSSRRALYLYCNKLFTILSIGGHLHFFPTYETVISLPINRVFSPLDNI